MNRIQEQYLAAKEVKDALKGGYAPGEGSPGLSSKIMPDSAACNRRRDLLREVLEQVGLERTLILVHAVAKELAEYEEMREAMANNPDQEEGDRLAHERSVGYHG